MSIEMNEYEWAERMLQNRDIGRKPGETLGRIAKYYYENHYSKKEVRRKLEEFLLQSDPKTNLNSWEKTLNGAIKGLGKQKLIRLKELVISEPEIQTIETLRGKQMQRLAFALLCAAKYWDSVHSRNHHWVNIKDNDLMRLANINTSTRRQSLMIGELMDAGLIRGSKKVDNLNTQVTFIEDGPDAIHIHDLRNLGYQYLKYCGEPYFECANCGITEKIREPGKGRPQKYCPSCAVQVRTQQNVNAVMRRKETVIAVS